MSGSGDKLSDKLKQELKSALSLVLKKVDQHDIPLALNQTVVHFDHRVSASTQTIHYQEPSPSLHNPLHELQNKIVKTHLEPTVDECVIPAQVSCRFEPSLIMDYPITAENTRTQTITFENMQATLAPVWKASKDGITKHDVPNTNTVAIDNLHSQLWMWPIDELKANTRRQDVASIKTRPQNIPNRFWTMPIKKTPIPPHRFAPFIRDQFRRKLSEKASTVPANVQIQFVFDRMDITIFQKMENDNNGNLLCFPKAESLSLSAMLSKPTVHSTKQLLKSAAKRTISQARNTPSATPPSEPVLLIFGQRIDNKESISMIVPVSQIDWKEPPVR